MNAVYIQLLKGGCSDFNIISYKLLQVKYKLDNKVIEMVFLDMIVHAIDFELSQQLCATVLVQW